jgi:hypothetical protein
MKIRVSLIASTVIMASIFIAITPASIAATQQKCDAYKKRIEHLQKLNAKGGKAKQQETRRQKISQYETDFYQCSNRQTIGIVTNHPVYKKSHERLRIRSSQTTSVPLQQLFQTCNYWIAQTNAQPNWDNANYRDTACRAADEYENVIDNPVPQLAPNTRKLKDCIKPNNVIDNDVSECLKGNKDATWKL